MHLDHATKHYLAVDLHNFVGCSYVVLSQILVHPDFSITALLRPN